MKNILAFSASNSKNSINKQLLTTAITQLEEYAIVKTDIRDYPMPLYSIDRENEDGFPESARELYAQFQQMDAFVIATPEHNGSMPAVFKNTIDWLSRLADSDIPLFGNKPVLLLSASPGPRGGATNLQTLTQIMPYWGADISGAFSLGSFYDNYSDGQLTAVEDQHLNEVMGEFVDKL